MIFFLVYIKMCYIFVIYRIEWLFSFYLFYNNNIVFYFLLIVRCVLSFGLEIWDILLNKVRLFFYGLYFVMEEKR